MATYGFDSPTNFDTTLVTGTPPTTADWISGIMDNHCLAKLQLDWTTIYMKKYANCKHHHVTL